MSFAASASRRPAHTLSVASSTWMRESNDLYDFETSLLESKTFSVDRSATLVRNMYHVEAVGAASAMPREADAMLRVVERGGVYWVDRSTAGAHSGRIWTVVRDSCSPVGHRLAKDDVIRLGRFRFRVRQLVTEEDGVTPPDLGFQDTSVECETCAEATEGKVCRICLMEGSTEEDPLIRPCRCMGSIERVHLKCLREWTNSRLNLGESPSGSYTYKAMPCELCKTTLPTYVTTEGGARSPLVDLPRTRPPYIVLESLVREASESSRSTHVMSLAEKPLRLGRGQDNDLRIADVSISRCHAKIHHLAGHFFLQDNSSKFGTLVAMRRPRQIEIGRPISVQVGRTVLSFSLAPTAAISAELDASASRPRILALTGEESSDIGSATSRGAPGMAAADTASSSGEESGGCMIHRMSV